MTTALIVINLFLSFICLYFIIENYSLNKMLENSMEANKEYRQKLIKIQNIIRISNMLPCKNPWADCENCKDEITDNGERCMKKVLKEIRSFVERV